MFACDQCDYLHVASLFLSNMHSNNVTYMHKHRKITMQHGASLRHNNLHDCTIRDV